MIFLWLFASWACLQVTKTPGAARVSIRELRLYTSDELPAACSDGFAQVSIGMNLQVRANNRGGFALACFASLSSPVGAPLQLYKHTSRSRYKQQGSTAPLDALSARHL